MMRRVVGSEHRDSYMARGRTATVLLAGLILVGCSPGASTAGRGSTATATLSASPTTSSSPTPRSSPSPSPTPAPTSSPTGSLAQARMQHTATLLLDGRVLIAGGSDWTPEAGMRYFASAEIYDPESGEFTRTGSMIRGRAWHTATLLTDGRVLIAGGYGPLASACVGIMCTNMEPLASAELFDFRTGKFTRTGSMSVPHVLATATRLLDGRVLMTGGSETVPAELYDPGSGRFVAKTLAVGTDIGATSLLPDGRVLVTSSAEPARGVCVYDPGLSTFTTSAAPPALVPRSALALRDGRVLLADSDYLEVYDPAADAFTDVGWLPRDEADWGSATWTLLADGRVLIWGGRGPNDPQAQAVIYDPAGGLGLLVSLGAARSNHTATLLRDGSVLVAGGADGPTLSSAELLWPAAPTT